MSYACCLCVAGDGFGGADGVLEGVAEALQAAPRSIRSVAVCTADDAVLRPLLERHKGCEVRVYPARLVDGVPYLIRSELLYNGIG